MDADIKGLQNYGSEALTSGNASERVKRKLSRPPTLTEAYVALLLFMVVYCARPEDWIPGLSHVPLAKIAGVLALIAFLLSIGQIRQRLPREVIFLFLLTAQLFATVPMSPVWKGGAFQKTLDFAKVGLIVLVMVMAVNTAKRLRHLLFIQAASVAAISAVAVLKGRMLGNRLNGVLNGNYSNPNDLALSIVISLPFCLSLFFLTKNTAWKAAWAFAMLVMAYAVFLTGSRGGFIALAVTSAVCLWEFAIRGRRSYLIAVMAVVGVVLWVSSSSVVGGRLKGTFDANDDVAAAYSSSEARQQLFWRSIEVTRRHPLFGVGPGNFSEISGLWHETHNSYTQMSSEGGIPAFILFVAILWSGVKNIKSSKRASGERQDFRVWAGAIRASLAGLVIGSLFSSYAYQFFPYFIVAYSTVLLRIATSYALRSKRDELARKKASGDSQAGAVESTLPGNASETQMLLGLPDYRRSLL